MTLVSLATKLQNPPSNFWKWFGGAVALLVIGAVSLALMWRSRQLATMKTALAAAQLEVQQKEDAAKLEANEAKRKELETVAASARKLVEEQAAVVATAQAAHSLEAKKIAAVAARDWDALNALAGVKVPKEASPEGPAS